MAATIAINQNPTPPDLTTVVGADSWLVARLISMFMRCADSKVFELFCLLSLHSAETQYKMGHKRKAPDNFRRTLVVGLEDSCASSVTQLLCKAGHHLWAASVS